MIYFGVYLSSSQMISRNLLGMDCISRLLTSCPAWSVYLHFLLTINLLILYTVLPGVLLFPRDPFFLSVMPRPLNTFMLWSANWNMMIFFIWVRSNYGGVFWFTCSFLHYKYLALPISEELHFKNSNSHSC